MRKIGVETAFAMALETSGERHAVRAGKVLPRRPSRHA